MCKEMKHYPENRLIGNFWSLYLFITSLYTIVLITDTGKALYRGVDATKVDDYTITSILQRIGTPKSGKKGKSDTPETPKA